jgi:hypothetical protein
MLSVGASAAGGEGFDLVVVLVVCKGFPDAHLDLDV